MSNHSNHLRAEERAVVQIEIQDGKSMRSIAKRLGRSPSTLSREVARQVAGLTASPTPAEPIARADYALSGAAGLSRAASRLSSFVSTWCCIAGSPNRLLPSFAICTRTKLASASATRLFTPTFMPVLAEG